MSLQGKTITRHLLSKHFAERVFIIPYIEFPMVLTALCTFKMTTWYMNPIFEMSMNHVTCVSSFPEQKSNRQMYSRVNFLRQPYSHIDL